MKKIVLILPVLTGFVFAQPMNALPAHEYIDITTQKAWISNSISTGDQGFDSWTISSGYHYPLLKNMNVYFATELTNETDSASTSQGLLSGIEYNFSERITFDGTVQAERVNEETIGFMGMSSKIMITDDINVKATFDLFLVQSPISFANYQLGVGFRF